MHTACLDPRVGRSSCPIRLLQVRESTTLPSTSAYTSNMFSALPHYSTLYQKEAHLLSAYLIQ